MNAPAWWLPKSARLANTVVAPSNDATACAKTVPETAMFVAGASGASEVTCAAPDFTPIVAVFMLIECTPAGAPGAAEKAPPGAVKPASAIIE